MSEQSALVVPDYATPETQDRPRKPRHRYFLWFIFIFLVVSLFLLLQKKTPGRSVSVSLSDFYEQLLAGKVRSLSLEQGKITGEFTFPQNTSDGVTFRFRTTVPSQFSSDWSFINWVLQNRNGAKVDVDNQDNLLLTVLVPLIPWLLIFGFIWFFVYRQLRGRSGTQAAPLRVMIVNPASPGEPNG
ncbi:MAG: ATP-dependent metallopeptidase FtsH/Yme1/Tma family protein [Bacillota bacterium]